MLRPSCRGASCRGLPVVGDVAAPRRVALEQGPAGLVSTRRMLNEQHQHAAVADRDALEAAEGGREGLEAGGNLRQRRAELAREPGGSYGVVDVVEAGQAEVDGH